MSRPRKPKSIIAEKYVEIPAVVDPKTDLAALSDYRRADLFNLHLTTLKGPEKTQQAEKAMQAVQLAINITRLELKTNRLSQPELKAIFEDQARLAAGLAEHVETWTYYAALLPTTHPEASTDPLNTNRHMLADMLRLINERSSAIADQIDPGTKRYKHAQHVLAKYLIRGIRDGHLPMKYSASKSSKLAHLFCWCCDEIGIDPGDPHEYLKDK